MQISLYRAPIRDILLQLAKADRFEGKWTSKIHDEWMAALKRNRPDIDDSRIEGLRDKMDAETRDPYITGYESIIEGLYLLEDPNDRHVLAAAIAGQCPTIVTMNVRHFPAARLKPFGITARHPDIFLLSLFAADPEEFCGAVRTVRIRLKNPSYDVEAYLGNLAKAGLVDTVDELRKYAEPLE